MNPVTPHAREQGGARRIVHGPRPDDVRPLPQRRPPAGGQQAVDRDALERAGADRRSRARSWRGLPTECRVRDVGGRPHPVDGPPERGRRSGGARRVQPASARATAPGRRGSGPLRSSMRPVPRGAAAAGRPPAGGAACRGPAGTTAPTGAGTGRGSWRGAPRAGRGTGGRRPPRRRRAPRGPQRVGRVGRAVGHQTPGTLTREGRAHAGVRRTAAAAAPRPGR